MNVSITVSRGIYATYAATIVPLINEQLLLHKSPYFYFKMLCRLFWFRSQFTAMKLLILLLVIKKVSLLDLINGKVPGGWTFQDVMNHLHQKGYNEEYNIPGDTRRFQLDKQQQIIQQQQQPNFGVPNMPNSNGQGNQTCCPRGDCPNPCMRFQPYYYVPQPPLVVPMRTTYEKVVHDHPPVHKIEDIIKRDKKEYKRWKKNHLHHNHHEGQESCDEDDDSTYNNQSNDIQFNYSDEDFDDSGSV